MALLPGRSLNQVFEDAIAKSLRPPPVRFLDEAEIRKVTAALAAQPMMTAAQVQAVAEQLFEPLPLNVSQFGGQTVLPSTETTQDAFDDSAPITSRTQAHSMLRLLAARAVEVGQKDLACRLSEVLGFISAVGEMTVTCTAVGSRTEDEVALGGGLWEDGVYAAAKELTLKLLETGAINAYVHHNPGARVYGFVVDARVVQAADAHKHLPINSQQSYVRIASKKDADDYYKKQDH